MDVEKALQELREYAVLLGWSVAFTKDPSTETYCIVLFSGKEKVRVVLGAGSDGAKFRSDFRILSEDDLASLVDRSSSSMTVSPPDVSRQRRLIDRRFKLGTKPRMAVVVARDFDFGMMRMLEMSDLESLPHEFKVFPGTDEACDWLGFDKDDIEWPK